MSKPKYQIGDRDAVFCVACGDILGNGSNYNLCFDCWNDHVYEMEIEPAETEDFVPTDWPLSCKCHD